MSDIEIDHQHEWRFIRQEPLRDDPTNPDSLVKRYDIFYCIHCLEYARLEYLEQG